MTAEGTHTWDPHSSSVRATLVPSFIYEDAETLRSNGARSQYVEEEGFEPRQSSARTDRHPTETVRKVSTMERGPHLKNE